METVIEVNGEKYHLVNKSFVGWLKHINNFNSRYKSFEDWYSEFTFLGKDKIKGIESIFIFNSREKSKFYHYFEKGFCPVEAIEDFVKPLLKNN